MGAGSSVRCCQCWWSFARLEQLSAALVVTLEQLAALDLLIWLETTERAAAMAYTDQSTISRRSRVVLQEFGVMLSRNKLGRTCTGETELLRLQRLVHQQARLRGRQPLRLQVPYWTRSMPHYQLTEGWCATPAEPALACHDPVGLLRDRVIDACLITSCQLPDASDDLVLLELYRRPIELTVFASSDPATMDTWFGRQRDGGLLRLEPMAFLPNSCACNAAGLFQVLTGAPPPRRSACQPAHGASATLGLSFLTPEMRAVQQRPWQLHDGLEPCLYVERLAVLAENVQEPPVQRLIDHLLPQFVAVQA